MPSERESGPVTKMNANGSALQVVANSMISCENERADVGAALVNENGLLNIDALKGDAYCWRRAAENPDCLVCLRMQGQLAKWEVNQHLLRRALCGRWELLRSLEAKGNS